MLLGKGWKESTLCVRLCRLYLGVEALVKFGLAVALLANGAAKTKTWPADGLLNPYASMLAVGALGVPASVVAMAGAITANRLLLFLYVFSIIILATLLAYGSVVCFVSAKTTTKLASTLSKYVNDVSHLGGASAGALTIGGSVCAACAALSLVSLACAARAAGWRWTITKMPATLNMVALILSGILLLIASASDLTASTDNTRFAVAAGCFGVLNSLFGFFTLVLRWPRCMRIHASTTVALAVVGVAVASACIAAGNVRASESVCDAIAALQQSAPPSGNETTPASPPPAFPPECLVAGRLSGDRLLLVGSYAVVASVTSFVHTALLWREIMKPPVKAPTKPSTVELMYNEFVEESARAGAGAREEGREDP